MFNTDDGFVKSEEHRSLIFHFSPSGRTDLINRDSKSSSVDENVLPTYVLFLGFLFYPPDTHLGSTR